MIILIINDKDTKKFLSRLKYGCNNNCIEWLGARSIEGYGNFWNAIQQKCVRAHRYSWALFNGSIPKKMLVCHKCDNTSCVNPSHLFLGTDADNSKDKVNKKRQAYGEKQSTSLSNKDILDIFTLYNSGIYQSTIAKKYKISKIHVKSILNKRVWKEVSDQLGLEKTKEKRKVPVGDNSSSGRFKSEDIINMFKLRKEGKTNIEISKIYGIFPTNVSSYFRRVYWKELVIPQEYL